MEASRSAPAAFLVETDGLLTIVTSRGLVSYFGGQVTPRHVSDYTLLDPVSVLRTVDGELYIGMRHVVARLIPDEGGYREIWLVPPDCPRQVRRDWATCECMR